MDSIDYQDFLDELTSTLDADPRIGALTPVEAGEALIDLAQKELTTRAPELAWEKSLAVKEWLQGA